MASNVAGVNDSNLARDGHNIPSLGSIKVWPVGQLLGDHVHLANQLVGLTGSIPSTVRSCVYAQFAAACCDPVRGFTVPLFAQLGETLHSRIVIMRSNALVVIYCPASLTEVAHLSLQTHL